MAPIKGTPGNDTISGTAQDDQIYGFSGTDDLRGELGNDLVDGGAGNDFLYGGLGNDRVLGSAGDDWLFGDINAYEPNGGNDVLEGGSGSDVLFGGFGNDLLLGGAGADFLNGQEGSDTYISGTGNDTIDEYNFSEVEGDRDVYVFEAIKNDNFGKDEIFGFDIGSDTIQFKGYTEDDVTITPHPAENDNYLLFTFDDGSQLKVWDFNSFSPPPLVEGTDYFFVA
jgi:Ca2+-binding RTX toxin-like protein